MTGVLCKSCMSFSCDRPADSCLSLLPPPLYHAYITQSAILAQTGLGQPLVVEEIFVSFVASLILV